MRARIAWGFGLAFLVTSFFSVQAQVEYPDCRRGYTDCNTYDGNDNGSNGMCCVSICNDYYRQSGCDEYEGAKAISDPDLRCAIKVMWINNMCDDDEQDVCGGNVAIFDCEEQPCP